MKPSTSTNSLTALTEANLERECFICIDVANESGEPLVDSSLLRTCGCKFVVHPECWNSWMLDKSDWDCPICHKKSTVTANYVPNPIIYAIQRHELEVVARPVAKIRNFIIFFGVVVIFGIAFGTGIFLTKRS